MLEAETITRMIDLESRALEGEQYLLGVASDLEARVLHGSLDTSHTITNGLEEVLVLVLRRVPVQTMTELHDLQLWPSVLKRLRLSAKND